MRSGGNGRIVGMVFFTKHAIDKLRRNDIKKFQITKQLLVKIVQNRQSQTKTKYGEYATVSPLGKSHDLRVIYDIIEKDVKVITFHIAKRGRYL